MKRLLLFFSFLTIVFSVFADDGVCLEVQEWTYGNIYVKEPNDKIALEKELMVCGLDSITAVFVFKNTTDDVVTLNCAFPIRIYSPDSIRLDQPDKVLCVKSIGDYLQYATWGRDGRVPYCNIEQDGKPVNLLNVGIERNGFNYVNLHFHHQLTFLPNAYSKVVIRYHVEAYGCDRLEHYYDISTGGTWKGNINSFIAVVYDGSMSSELNYLNWEEWKEDGYGNCDVFRYGIGYKKDYKPHKNERFNFAFGQTEADARGYHDCPKYEAFKAVPLKDVKASPSWTNPEAMMDKDRFTASAIIDWKNATLEFTLPQAGYGPFMYNGTIGKLVTRQILDAFRDSVKRNNGFWKDGMDLSGIFPEDNSVYDYNRVSKLLIERLDQPSKSYSLPVSFTDPRRFPLAFDWERLNDVDCVGFFPAGRYRLSIKGVDSEYKNQDTTCITEFWFSPCPKELEEMILEDGNSSIPIFQKRFKDSYFYEYHSSNSSADVSEESPTPEPELFGKEKFQRTYCDAPEKAVVDAEEPQDSFPTWMVILGTVGVLCLVGGVVYWRRKR